jgi:hypothetical protein
LPRAPWEYFLGITLAAYRQLDQELSGGNIPTKADRVKLAVELLRAKKRYVAEALTLPRNCDSDARQ